MYKEDLTLNNLLQLIYHKTSPNPLQPDTIYLIYMYTNWRWPEGSLFNSFYTEVLGRALLLSLDCSTLPWSNVVSKVVDRSRGRPEGFLFNCDDTDAWWRPLLLFLDCPALPLIRALYCWVFSKEVSRIVFKVFGITRPGIEHRFTGPMANTLYSDLSGILKKNAVEHESDSDTNCLCVGKGSQTHGKGT